ncbi:MAG: hypothetical protein LBI77_03590 [Puniceicoccales bacterium]|jgi:A/G-specific adenine glycosylase|nr:hypothetical protein [Puniceicoccales bacterium]
MRWIKEISVGAEISPKILSRSCGNSFNYSVKSFTGSDREQAIGHSIVQWFGKNRRILPWRTNSSTYGRLVSEFMLQQTQVATVIPYFENWLRQFPSLEALAAASEREVMKAWEGLGYYSRARNLHETVKQIVKGTHSRGSPIFPETPKGWKLFPGIGDYTAHALASIAQNQHVAAVDGNVVRVLCRANGIQQIFDSKHRAAECIKKIAHRYIPRGKSADYNEAIMELGALICKPKNPSCGHCPIASHCRNFQEKLGGEQIPRFRKTIYVQRDMQRIFLCDSSSIILKKAKGRRLHNIFEMPSPEDITENLATHAIGKICRSIARERITETILEPDSLPDDLGAWVQSNLKLTLLPIRELGNFTLSGPHRRWLNGKIFAPGKIVPGNEKVEKDSGK